MKFRTFPNSRQRSLMGRKKKNKPKSNPLRKVTKHKNHLINIEI